MKISQSKIGVNAKSGKLRIQAAYHFMLLPGVILMLLFNYFPMYGIVMAFQKYTPALGFSGSKMVGLANFRYIFSLPAIGQLFKNTLLLACSNLLLDIIIPVVVAIMISEVTHSRYKRIVQTIVYLPHFLSWVMLGVIFKQMFAENGLFNNILVNIGLERLPILSNGNWFRGMLITTNSWKEFGWGTIIYLAAIVGVDPSLYEAAVIDGATRLQRIRHVTFPAIVSVIVLKLVLSLGSVLNANFDQVFNMYNVLVYDYVDIIDTYVYRMGLVQAQFSVATAVGLLKSCIGMILIVFSYGMASRFANYRIF